jgi:hypothetical protein
VRTCAFCKKTIHSKTSKGAGTNFHRHVQTHGMTLKEYKLWLIQNQLDRAQPAGGGGGAGFGDDNGDDFGGDFGGG